MAPASAPHPNRAAPCHYMSYGPDAPSSYPPYHRICKMAMDGKFYGDLYQLDVGNLVVIGFSR